MGISPLLLRCPGRAAADAQCSCQGGGSARGASCKDRALRPRPAQPPSRRRALGPHRCRPCHVPQHICLLTMPPAPRLAGTPRSPQIPHLGPPSQGPVVPAQHPCVACPRPACPHTPLTWSLEAPWSHLSSESYGPFWVLGARTAP